MIDILLLWWILSFPIAFIVAHNKTLSSLVCKSRVLMFIEAIVLIPLIITVITVLLLKPIGRLFGDGETYQEVFSIIYEEFLKPMFLLLTFQVEPLLQLGGDQ